MTTIDPRTVKHLGRNLYAAPDPLAWLALADVYEEAGDEQKAKLWRRRGEAYARLYQCAQRSAADTQDGYRFACVGRYNVYLHRRKKTVLVVVDGAGRKLRFLSRKGNLWSIHCAAAKANLDRYLARKCIELIDWCGAHEDGKVKGDTEQ